MDLIDQINPEILCLEDFNFNRLTVLQKVKKENRYLVTELQLMNKLFEPKTDSFIRNLISGIQLFPNVNCIILMNYNDIKDDELSCLGIQFFENLKSIKLINNSSLTGKTFDRIANNCSCLNTLYFTNSSKEIIDDEFDCHFYQIKNDHLDLLLRRNGDLKYIKLTINSIRKEIMNQMSQSTNLISIELFLGSIIYNNTTEFMNALFQLLGGVVIFLKVKMGDRIVANLKNNCLTLLNSDKNFSKFNDFNEGCINLFNSGRKLYESISLTGFVNFNNSTLEAISKCSSRLHTLELHQCGKNFDFDCAKLFVHKSLNLKFMFVTCANLSFGDSGKCFQFNDTIFAVLRRGMFFNHSIIKKLKYENKITSDVFDYLTDCFCTNIVSDESEESVSDCESTEEVEKNVIIKKRRV
jgi:hypothetical protein